jgi:hypothetical protein
MVYCEATFAIIAMPDGTWLTNAGAQWIFSYF